MMRVVVVLGLLFVASFSAVSAEDDNPVDVLAIETFDRVQPLSIRDGVEYCGLIGYDSSGELVATPAKRGQADSCEPEAGPDDFDVAAVYHTHGVYSEDADSEVPSPGDLRADFEEGVDGYIATPGGRVWLTVVEEKRAYTLCGLGCVVPDPSFEPCPAFAPGDEYTLETLLERAENDPGEC